MESMTGFGKGISQKENLFITVFARSLNHRFLDVILKVPRRYFSIEERIRKKVMEFFKRGRIEIWIKLSGITTGEKEVFLDIALAKKLKRTLLKLKDELGFEETLSFSDFLRFRDYLIFEEEEEDVETLWMEVEPALNIALSELKSMRKKEGEYLKEVLSTLILNLEEKVKKIEEIKEKVIEENKEKFKKRIEKLFTELKAGGIEEVRFYQELAYLMDKLDFTEELERLKMHVEHFKLIMKEEASGKKLDFLCQEMFRETNTMGNKAQSSEISFSVVEIKDIIEKLREQIQNVE